MNITQTCLTKILLSVLRTAYVYIFRFLTGFFFFCGCATKQSKQNSVKGKFFHHSSFKNNVNSRLQLYTEALHSDDFILFTSAQVVPDRRTLSKNNAPCVLLSLTLAHPFLNGCCLVGVCFLGFDRAFFLLFVGFLQPLITDSFEFKPAIIIGRWLTSAKLRTQSRCLLPWFINFFDRSGSAVYFSPGNGLKYAIVNKQ